MGCCVSCRHRKTTDSDDSSPDHPPDDRHHPHSDNRPPPNLALISSVRTLRSHLAMSPPSAPFHPRHHHHADDDDEETVLTDHHHEEEILYPIRVNPKPASSSSSSIPRRYGLRNKISSLDDDVDRAFVDLSTTTFNFSKEVHAGERTPSINSMRLGSDRWSVESPTPVPLAEIWKRRPPLPAADLWASSKRGINNRWDPPGVEFSDTSSSEGTKKERGSTVVRVLEGMNKKLPRKVTFGELPRRESVFEDGPGSGLGPRAARRVARSRVGGGWSPPEASRSFDDGMFLGMGGLGGGRNMEERIIGGSGRRQLRNSRTAVMGRNDDVLFRQRMRNAYDPANDLLSMEGFVFY